MADIYAPYLESYQGDAGRSGGKSISAVSNSMITTSPTTQFDLSVLSGLKPSDKYLGKNRVSDIQEAYQTYITGNKVGRGGQYAVDAAKKYGVSIVEAAKGYLQGVGLPIIPNAISNPITNTTTNTNTNTNTPFEVLADAFSKAFGNAVYNPPLQQQSYGYTPSELSTPLTQSSGGNVGLYAILAIVGVIGYFLYKKFAS